MRVFLGIAVCGLATLLALSRRHDDVRRAERRSAPAPGLPHGHKETPQGPSIAPRSPDGTTVEERRSSFPDYIRTSVDVKGTGEFDADVLQRKGNAEIVIRTDDAATRTTLAIEGRVQGLLKTRDESSRANLYVATVDLTSNRSRIMRFVDRDRDGVPDPNGDVLFLLEGAHVTDIAFSRDSGSLYVFDAPNLRILRWSDADGDRAPDIGTRTTFLDGSGGAEPIELFERASLEKAAPHAVTIRSPVFSSALMYDVAYLYRAADRNEDGVAEAVTVLQRPETAMFVGGRPSPGDTAVYAFVEFEGTYRIVDDAGETLATIQGPAYKVRLRRSLLAKEGLELLSSSGESLAVTVVTDGRAE